MHEHEARTRAFYDHEVEEPRGSRRRRQVADWGVGEDVFDRMPSRRFSRAEGAHARRPAEPPAPRPRLAGADERAKPPAAGVEAEPPAAGLEARGDASRAAAAGADFGVRADAAAARPRADLTVTRDRDLPRGRTEDGRRTILIGEPREENAAVAADGRRTVVIGARSAHAASRRPPRRGAERVGPRPDRIVAYAVALGVLLILIALLSAGH